jgi:LysM repeat protein
MMNQFEQNENDKKQTQEPGEELREGTSTTPERKIDFGRLWGRVLQMGLGEISLKLGTGLLTIALVLLVVWVMGTFYLHSNPTAAAQDLSAAAPAATPTPVLDMPSFNTGVQDLQVSGIQRNVMLHTNLPAKPRFEVATYEVQPGDTIFSIAEKFNLDPETIFWGNPYTLADDPHRLQPGQILNILPVNGVYYDWHTGDGLNGVADFFGVTPEDILNFEGNNLDPDTIGDYANPNIEDGTWLVVPGGEREFINWSAPRITRDDPSVAKIYGPGYCGEVYEGPIGYGTFVWPAPNHWLSGYDYSPSTNHWGIDIGGSMGDAIYATDSGVVVYAGWNDYGYGNVIVIDHGNGWQSLYAHLSSYNVECGSYVYQGDVIGAMGSTGNSSGPHLHFELRSDEYGRANPHNFLP